MKGLELARLYYEQYGLPMLRRDFPEYRDLLAAGLVGQGSECLGFDDEISRDHDFGPGFCLWLPRRAYEQAGERLQRAYAALPVSIPECAASALNPERCGRVGVHTIEDFYRGLIGRPDAPETPMDWLRIPEKYLSMAVNGAVFSDPLGEFTAVRRVLQAFYPEDVVKKKLAADCALMAQSGQYNYGRCLRRRDFGAASLACGEFVRAALAALYLLNGQYLLFYKWAFRGTQTFTLLRECAENVRSLATMPDLTGGAQKQQMIEEICLSIAKELVARGWSQPEESFMQYHAQKVTQSIRDGELRALHIMVGGT